MKPFSKYILTFFIVYLQFPFSSGLNSQALKENDRLDMFSNDIQSSLQGSFHVFKNPVNWEKSDWLYLGGTIVGATLLFSVDNKIDRFFKRNRNSSLDKLADFGSFFGSPIAVVALTGSIYSYGLLFKNDWARETAILFTSSLIAGGVIQTFSKTMAGRARPYMDLGKRNFKPFPSTDNFHSFVSGHTLVSVSTALILAKRVNNYYLKSFFYTLGGIGAWARMYQRNHFSSDVFLGAALGYATVLAAIKWQKQSLNKGGKERKTSYSFSFNAHKIGLNIHF